MKSKLWKMWQLVIKLCDKILITMLISLCMCNIMMLLVKPPKIAHHILPGFLEKGLLDGDGDSLFILLADVNQ